MDSVVRIGAPFFPADEVVFGILMLVLGVIFWTTKTHPGKAFYHYLPALLLCYFVPSILTTVGLISPGWFDLEGARPVLAEVGVVLEGDVDLANLKELIIDASKPNDAMIQFALRETGETMNAEEAKDWYESWQSKKLKPFIHKSNLYYMASRFLLPACLVLLTLCIDLREIIRLGPKALGMFLAGTFGVVVGGPLAILIVSFFAPEVVGGAGPEAVWRGLSTVAGSWIGGGANMTAMEVLFEPSGKLFSQMIAVDIIVAETWMFFLLLGVGKSEMLDRWFKADSSSITQLKEKMEAFSQSVARVPTFVDLMVILGISFGITGLAHFFGGELAEWFKMEGRKEWASKLSLTSSFFWLIVLATVAGVILSFTKVRSYEGAGASKIGTVFIYILVATIGMKMDVLAIFENPGIFVVGGIWMLIHIVILVIAGKILRAPYFFLAVGSKANIGGAASAPVVAGAFHPSLAPVGVLLAVLGYAIGTGGAWLCALLMEQASSM